MERSFFPKRIWEWLLVVMIVALLTAIFMPVYAYSGPGLSYGRVAHELQYRHKTGNGWAASNEIYPIKRIPPGRECSFRLTIESKKSAVYEITIDGKSQNWLVNDQDKPKPIGS